MMNRKNNVFQRYFQNEEKAVNGKVFMEIIMKKISQIVLVSLAVLILTFLLGCPAPNKEEAKVTEVTVSPATSTIAVDETVDLTAAVKGTGDYDKTVTWSSTPEGVVTVSVSGLVKGLKEGKATVTATANGNSDIKATATIMVEEVLEVKIDFAKFDKSANENKNIYNHFINEDYDPSSPLVYKLTVELPAGVTVDPPLSDDRNYSDQDADIFTVTEGSKIYKFRLNIFRRPIIVTERPAANTDTDYDSSGAAAISIRRFVQTDYYYVPTVVDDVVTDHPAPTFALFPETAKPTADNILSSPVRVLRNFVTNDGNTVFFTSADDGVADDDWSETGLNTNADLLATLTPSTKYSLHWAVNAHNGKFSGSLPEVSTTALPGTVPSTGDGVVKYFGMGGMALHRVADYDQFSMLTLLYLDGEYDNTEVTVFAPIPVTGVRENLIFYGTNVRPEYFAFKPHTKVDETKYTGTSYALKSPGLFDDIRRQNFTFQSEYVSDNLETDVTFE